MLRFRRLHRFFGSKRVAFLEACIIGVVSGLAAVALKQSVEILTDWRLDSTAPAWLLLPSVGLIGGIASGWLLQWVAPEAIGSGIPKVKAALAYVDISLDLRVALAKLSSTILALGAGLSLGRQGPTVQIGAALAAQLSQWVPTSPEYRRQLIAAGAAAGLAAGFNAPIAGVLFVVEELLQDFSGLTLGTAILASFVGAVVSRLLGGQGLNLNNFGMLQTGLSVQDLPFLALLGVMAGIFGGLFSKGIFSSLNLFRQMTNLSLPLRIGLAGFCTGLVGAALPIAAQDNTGLREFLVTGGAAWQTIAIVFIAKFGLTLLAYGSGASGGLFAPALVLGSALGCLVSFVAQASHAWMGLPAGTLESSNTTTYALTGMGAFFSAVTRGPITAIVIVFEMTANFNLVLPLMIGSGLAYLLSDKISSGSIYDRLLASHGVELNPIPSNANPWANLTAEDLMQRRVETLSASMTVYEALEAFSRSHHRGFPVLAQGKLVGIVTQSDLGDKTQTSGLLIKDIMTTHPVTVTPESSLPQVLDLLNRLKISRLPVTEGKKLVGIITRGDIIRAESERLSGKGAELGPAATPSCGVYRTRSPATGRGRLLLPLSDSDTAPLLLNMAIAIAQQEQYELECLHVVLVPRFLSPEEAPADMTQGQQLLSYAQQVVQNTNVPLHTQIRVAHEVAPTLLEVIKKRHIDMVILGWKRPSITPGRVLGNVVDTLLRQSPCPVIVVKPGQITAFNRWLLPSAGGPNSKLAWRLLPALMTLGSEPQVCLCAIAPNGETKATLHRQLIRRAKFLERHLHAPIKTRMLVDDNVSDAIVKLSYIHQSDVVILGASRESLFSHVIKGNIPVEVAYHSKATMLLVQYNSISSQSGTQLAGTHRMISSPEGASDGLLSEPDD
ncbi:chloride channel protein [Oscillatoria sp. CS-180]|uniref:chloride channel protein n=1 Tax=Oscillatoria sp. CS-180 TaxID=3021720 RepID=UPI00232D58D3|nr:chloride channel protein [Oscillatoria sp. CS-180]MDB9524972.1 chloride channel protein [Oscillatoria sp. CS-180]